MITICFKISKEFSTLIQKNNENINQDTQLAALESKPEFPEHDVKV
jgi:hypothetical protein